MHMLSQWLNKLLGAPPSIEPKAGVIQSLLEMLRNQCPRCKQSLRGHLYQMYAMTTATPERQEELHNFLENAKQHDWEALSHFQDFDPLKNSVQIFALECPDHNLSMLFIRDPFELFDGDSLESWEPLQEADAKSWRTFLDQAKWVVFS